MADTKTNQIIDFSKRSTDEQRSDLLSVAIMWINANIVKSSGWNRCYGLKQIFTSIHGYCYQSDMAYFFSQCGFETKTDEYGDHFVKARLGSATHRYFYGNH